MNTELNVGVFVWVNRRMGITGMITKQINDKWFEVAVVEETPTKVILADRISMYHKKLNVICRPRKPIYDIRPIEIS